MKKVTQKFPQNICGSRHLTFEVYQLRTESFKPECRKKDLKIYNFVKNDIIKYIKCWEEWTIEVNSRSKFGPLECFYS